MQNHFKRQLVGNLEHASVKEQSLSWLSGWIDCARDREPCAEDITVSVVVTARINSRKYTGTVLDLLEWSQKAKQKRKPAAKAKKQKKSATKGRNRRYTSTLDCIILPTVAIYTDDSTYVLQHSRNTARAKVSHESDTSNDLTRRESVVNNIQFKY